MDKFNDLDNWVKKVKMAYEAVKDSEENEAQFISVDTAKILVDIDEIIAYLFNKAPLLEK